MKLSSRWYQKPLQEIPRFQKKSMLISGARLAGGGYSQAGRANESFISGMLLRMCTSSRNWSNVFDASVLQHSSVRHCGGLWDEVPGFFFVVDSTQDVLESCNGIWQSFGNGVECICFLILKSWQKYLQNKTIVLIWDQTVKNNFKCYFFNFFLNFCRLELYEKCTSIDSVWQCLGVYFGIGATLQTFRRISHQSNQSTVMRTPELCNT